MSCQTEPTSGNLIGEWISSYNEIFKISESELSYFYEENEFYAGNNLKIIKLTEESGYIYIQYTRAMKNSNIGKWYAHSYKNLTQDSVQISMAYKEGGKTSCETLEEAVKEFTIENGYFAGCSDCVKK